MKHLNFLFALFLLYFPPQVSHANLLKNTVINSPLEEKRHHALFIGRTEAEGADINNPVFLQTTNFPANKIDWTFIDPKPRSPESSRDMVATIDQVIHSRPKTTKNNFQGVFDLIVIDSGAAGYFLNTVILRNLIDWVKPGSNSLLIFENLPTVVNLTCVLPNGLFSVKPWEKQRRWQVGEKITSPNLEDESESLGGELSAYPDSQDLFCEIYFNNQKKGEEWGDDLKQASLKAFDNSDEENNRILNEIQDPQKTIVFKRCEDKLGNYFKKNQENKIHKELSGYFDRVSLQKNNNSHNDAPFVKGKTYRPANNLFWWVAQGKKTETEL
jgi:hypothetical protein